LESNEKSIINKLKEIILDYINEKNLESYKLAVELLEILKNSDEEAFKDLLNYIKKGHYRKRNLMSLIDKLR